MRRGPRIEPKPNVAVVGTTANTIARVLAIVFIIYMLAAIGLARYYLYSVPDSVWNAVLTEERYRGKCYTNSFKGSNVHCVGTGLDTVLGFVVYSGRVGRNLQPFQQ